MREKKKVMRELLILLFRLLMFLSLLYLVFGVAFGVAVMNNNDMLPKINAGDLMLYFRMETNYSARDVLLFERDGTLYCGRIIGKEGDRIEIGEDELKINGSLQAESDIYYGTNAYEGEVKYPVTVGEDEFFVLCDHREGALDSRMFGTVKKEEIKGKVITIVRRIGI